MHEINITAFDLVYQPVEVRDIRNACCVVGSNVFVAHMLAAAWRIRHASSWRSIRAGSVGSHFRSPGVSSPVRA
jgi:hypothetical protein